MRILVLVIVSFDKPVYYDMLRVWREMYLNQTDNDSTNDSVWFIQCKPESEWIGDIVNDIPLLKQSQSQSLCNCLELDIANKTLFVKGNECLIPGILHKTVEALSYFLSMDPSIEFIWRTNLSSVLDFAGLQRYVEKTLSGGALTKGFYGGYIGKAVGENIFFASGAGFLMSRDVAEYLVSNRDSLRWDLIDDVAIGALLEPKFGIQFIERLWIQNGDEEIGGSGVFHYRCESYMHLRTVEFMRYVIRELTAV